MMTPQQAFALARRLWPAVVGFVVGAVIGVWFMGPDPDEVEMTMGLVCGGIGALSGVLVHYAVQAKNRARAMLVIGGGASLCVIVGLVMIAYRWIFR